MDLGYIYQENRQNPYSVGAYVLAGRNKNK